MEKNKEKIIAVFTFGGGEVLRVRLMPEYAPISVENFIRYAESGFYDGTVIHRIIFNVIIQGGGYDLTEEGLRRKETFEPIKGEFASNGCKYNTLSHTAGVISMARTAVMDSATSQFFILASDYKAWDGSYAAFGRVENEDGLEALRRMSTNTNPYDPSGTPLETIILTSVRVVRE